MARLVSAVRRVALVCPVLVVLLVLAAVPPAWGVGPVFSAPSPPSGSAVTVSSTQLSVAVSDPAGLSSTPTMTVDGRAVGCWVEYFDTGGTWYDDGCESWYEPAYDYTRGTIRGNPGVLANGSHTISVRETNKSGVAATYAWTFTVSAAPVLSAPSPANGSWTAALQPALSAKVAANAAITSAFVTVDGLPASATYDPVTKLVTGIPLAQLVDGVSHNAVATVTDAYGLSGSLTWSFGTHSTGPNVSGQSPASGVTLSASNAQIRFSAVDPATFSSVSLKLDGVAVPVGWTYVDTGGTWYDDGCDSWYEPAYDYTRINASYAASMKDGTHTVIAQVTARTGLSTTSTWSFNVSTAPVFSSPSPANGGWTTTLTPAVTVKVADNGTIATSTMTLDGVPLTAIYDASARTIRGTPATPLTDDSAHTAVVTATDDSGNTARYEWTFRARTGAPAFSASSPGAGSVASSARPVIRIDVADATQLSTAASMSVDGVKVACWFTYFDTGGVWYDDGCEGWYEPAYDVTRGTLSYTPGSNLSNGPHTVTVEVANSLGTKATSSWSFTVATPPTLGSPAPANGSCVASLSPAISVAVAANSAISAASAAIDGAPAAAVYDETAKVVRVVPLEPLADQSVHTVSVTATDAAGLSATYTWAFKTDVTPPVIGAVTPAADATGSSARPLITVAASDWAGMAALHSMKLDGVPVAAQWTYVDTGGTWYDDGCESWYEPAYDYTRGTLSYQPPNLGDGPHTATVQLADAAGLPTTTTWTFTVAAPPQVTSPAPADGSWVTTLTPEVRAKVTENSTVTATSVTIDGVTVPSIYDAVSKTVTARVAAPLADDSPHSVAVSVTDAAGLNGSLTWSFKTHTAPPSPAQASPATSAAVWDPVVSLRVSDMSGLYGAATMLLDGVAVPASFAFDVISEEWVGTGCDAELVQVFDYTKATVSYRASKLGDGAHTASVQARNNAGTSVTYAWTFDVKAPPKLADPKPVAGSVVTTQSPAISFAVAENSGIASVSATVDGVNVPAVYDQSSGRVTVLPDAPLANDLDHRVAATVTDTAGNSADVSWTFHIQTLADMPGTGAPDCTSCHTAYPAAHPMSDCNACHGPGGPVEDCRNCHGYYGHGPEEFDAADWSGPYSCTRCHQSGGSVPTHPSGDAYHVTARDMTPCRPCHVSPLTNEHYRYKDTAGAPLTCATCHLSANTRVTSAIAAGNTDCGACHDIGGGSHLEQHPEATLSAECSTCHQRNIVTEHLSNTKTQSNDLSCDTCHASSDANVQNAIASGNTTCSACHATSHSDLAALHVPTDVESLSCGGQGCHGSGDALALHAGRLEGGCAVCHANPARGDLTAGKVTTACGGCHTESGVDYHLNMAVHISTPASYETCGHCHHAWGSNPLRGPDVTRHEGECRTCHNATIDIASLSTECGSCHKVEGTDFHVDSLVDHTAATSASLDCARCHKTTNVQQLHASVGCDACHTTYGCSECHSMHMGTTGGLLAGVECARCHTASGTDYHRSMDASHTFSAMDPGCESTDCHSSNLPEAHRSYVGTGSPNPQYPDTCALCHLNNDPSRIPADATADCSSCHTLHGDIGTLHAARNLPATVQVFAGSHMGVPGRIQVDCGLCHEVGNIALVHGNRCSTCHPSPRDSFTTWSGGCQQNGCHVTYHEAADAGHTATIDSCSCHDESLFVVRAANCGYCHALVDHETPVTTSDAKASYVGPATIQLSAKDVPAPGGSGVAHTYWVLDNGERNEGVTVVVPQAATAVAHTLEYWSVDRAGNIEATTALTLVVAPDTLPPVTTSDVKASYYGAATIRLIPTDNGSTPPATYYSLDGGATTTGTIVTVPPPASGSATHTIDFWSVDPAGNRESRRTATFVVAVDDIPPVTTSDLKPAYRLGARAGVRLSATDIGAGVQQIYYSRDGETVVAGISFYIDCSVEGVGSVQFWSVDKAGNTETRHVVTYLIDGTAPITTCDAAASYEGPAHIHLSSADGSLGSGVAATYLRLDGGDAVVATETTVFSDGSHVLEYWSVDAVGIEEAHKTATFTVTGGDAASPITTSDAVASYVGSATIQLSATDDGGSGLASTYWRLDGGVQRSGPTVTSNVPGAHSLEFWSVDAAGNEERPHKSVTFTVSFPPNTGMIRFIWNNPPPGAWTYYYVYVYDSSNRLIASAYNTTGCWDTYVPVSSTPYRLRADWYDPLDPGYPMTTQGTVLVDSPGKIVNWGY